MRSRQRRLQTVFPRWQKASSMNDNLHEVSEEVRPMESGDNGAKEEAHGSMSTLSGMALSPIDYIVYRLDGNPEYIKYLLAQRPYIRSAITYPPKPMDDESRADLYSSSIGGAIHCDIIELDIWLETLSHEDRSLLFSWAEKQGRKPAFGAARIRRVEVLVKQWRSRR